MTTIFHLLVAIGCFWLALILHNRAVNDLREERTTVYLAEAFAIVIGIAAAAAFAGVRP